MAKYDDQLSRMQHLMEYGNKLNENKGSNKIEYHTEGADGKVYGILKEGTKYYIMTTEKGKEQLAESYEYIGGFRYRGENAFTSYNKASKILEEKMIALNEEYGIHKDVSTVDFNRSKKVLETLTEEARTELDKVRRIMENSESLGIKKSISYDGTPNPESKGDPFEEKANPVMEKDVTATAKGGPEKANKDYTDASNGVESEMTSDKAPTKNDTNAIDDMEKAKVDIDGTSVATENPKGGKAVVVKEEFDPVVGGEVDDIAAGNEGEDIVGIDDTIEGEGLDDAGLDAPVEGGEDIAPSDFGAEDEFGGEDEEDFDNLMLEFEEKMKAVETEDALKGPKGNGSSVAIEEGNKVEETEAALKGPEGNGDVLTWDKLNESQQKYVSGIVDGVVKSIMESRQKENRAQMLENRIVAAVMHELNCWGDHPSYRKQPMTTPPDKEVIVNTGDHDWHDESAKGQEPYGQGPGEGIPFTGAVKLIAEDVMKILKESLLGEKKK